MDRLVDQDAVVNGGAIDMGEVLDLIWLMRWLVGTWRELKDWWQDRRRQRKRRRQLPASC